MTQNDNIVNSDLNKNPNQRFTYDKQTLTITIDNLTELSLEELEEFQRQNIVNGIIVLDQSNFDRENQANHTKFSVNEYIEVLNKVDEFSKGLKDSNLSQEEKFMILYSRLTKNVVYDNVSLNPTTEEEFVYYMNYQQDSMNLRNIFLRGTCVCAGFSQGLYQLCLVNGIDARSIYGTGLRIGHAWNQIKLGEEWIDCDPTFDATDCIGKHSHVSHIGMDKSKFWNEHHPSGDIQNLIENKKYQAVGEFYIDEFLCKEFGISKEKFNSYERGELLDFLDEFLTQGKDVSKKVQDLIYIKHSMQTSSNLEEDKNEEYISNISFEEQKGKSFSEITGHSSEYFVNIYGISKESVKQIEDKFLNGEYIVVTNSINHLLQESGFEKKDFELIEYFRVPIGFFLDSNATTADRTSFVYDYLEQYYKITKYDVSELFKRFELSPDMLKEDYLMRLENGNISISEITDELDKNLQNEELMSEYEKYPPEIRDYYFNLVSNGELLDSEVITFLKYNQGKVTLDELNSVKKHINFRNKIKNIEESQKISFTNLKDNFGITEDEYLKNLDILFRIENHSDYNELVKLLDEKDEILRKIADENIGIDLNTLKSKYNLTDGQILLIGQIDYDGKEFNLNDMLNYFTHLNKTYSLNDIAQNTIPNDFIRYDEITHEYGSQRTNAADKAIHSDDLNSDLENK